MAARKTRRNEKSVKKLASLIKDIQFAMLTTVCPDGTLRSRPMATQREEFDGVLWFFTDDHSAKVYEIENDTHVNVSYADPRKNNYVSISGRASLVKDRVLAREMWNPFYKAWFPKGLDDPRLALLRVTVEQAEYWDSPSSTLVHLAGVIKATVTGKPAKGGENEKVTLRKRSRASSGKTAGKAKSRPRRRPRSSRARAGRR